MHPLRILHGLLPEKGYFPESGKCDAESAGGQCFRRSGRSGGQTEKGREDDPPVYDTLLLRFYEREMYERVVNSGDRTTYTRGLLTELRYSSTQNDNSWLKTSNYQNYWADVRLGKRTYNVFIYEPNSQADLIDEDLKKTYLYMLRINYEGCFINTFRVNGDGEVTYADDNIRKGFVDAWDPNAEGIPDGSVIPSDFE